MIKVLSIRDAGDMPIICERRNVLAVASENLRGLDTITGTKRKEGRGWISKAYKSNILAIFYGKTIYCT